MKKILTVLIMIITAMPFTHAGERVTRDQKELPKAALSFISQHFPERQISYIKIDHDFFRDKKYEVVLTNGFELEFDKRGEWKEVDCKREAVPSAIIPVAIREYIQANFSDNAITQIDRNRYGYDVELKNDLSVEFDKNGIFRRLDD